MAAKCICLLWLGIYFGTLGSARANTSFPLSNCRGDKIDLLLVAGGIEPTEDSCSGPGFQNIFFKDLLDLFLSPSDVNMTRLHVAVTSATASGLTALVSFQDYNTPEDLLSGIPDLKLQDGDRSVQPSWTVKNFEDHTQQVFSKTEGSREDALHLVVMVVTEETNWTENDVTELIAVEEKNGVKLFIIMIGSEEKEEAHAIAIAQLPGVLRIPSFENLLGNQLISLVLCEECKPGWFRLEHHENTRHLLSCYFFNGESTDNIGWLEAYQTCELQGAHLASLESQEEVEYIRSMLDIWNQKMRYLHSENVSVEVNDIVYIGLKRDKETLAGRFRWLSDLPLVQPRWYTGNPDDGLNIGCGAWLFKYRDRMENVTVNGTVSGEIVYDDQYVDGWIDIGCGYKGTPLILCEVNLPRMVDQTKRRLNVRPANRTRFDSALQRGEVMNLDDRIVSVSAHVQNPLVYKMLKDQGLRLPLFSCEDETFDDNLIPYSYVCDHVSHCSNERDEEICEYRLCDPKSEFTCASSQCVPLDARCDVYADCLDGSDEEDCTECKGRSCCDGTCLPKHWFFDGQVDCSGCTNDFENHINCDKRIDDETIWPHTPEAWKDDCVFTCNRSKCIFPQQLNDGVLDCQGPEGPLDETIGKLESSNSCYISELSHMKWAPRCVYVKDRFGGVLGCRDMSHLHDCDTFLCPEGYVKCPESFCIPLHLVNDGNMDCAMGEDENYMESHNCTGNFDCWDSDVCLHPDLVCDGSPHCPWGDDELNCHVTCAAGFQCIGGTVITKNYNRSEPLQSLAFIDQRTRYVDLSGVDLSLPFTEENRGKFTTLIEINFSGCRLNNTLGNFAFNVKALRTVSWIDLSNNRIEEITVDSMFKHMTNLRVLNLSGNRRLAVIQNAAFIPSDEESQLEYLDLSRTRISAINEAIFQGLNNLGYLNLSYTEMKRLDSLNTFPKNFKLQVLDLRETSLFELDPDCLNGISVLSHLYTDNYKICCPQVRGEGIPGYACHAPNDAISSCSDLIDEIVQRFLVWLVGLIAVVGNATVLVCRLAVERDAMRKASSTFMMNLAVSDFTMGVYLLIIAAIDTSYRGTYVWNEESWRHSALCQAAGFLSMLSSETSTFFIFLITIDRFMVIKFPLGQYRFSNTAVTVSCLVAWISGFILALIPVLPPFSHWKMQSVNGMCLGLPLTTEKLEGWEYSVAIFIVLNFLMFAVIAIGQFLIYRAMSGNRLSKSFTTQSSARRLQDIAVAKQLSLVVLSDFLCWFPIGLMGLLALSGRDIGSEAYAWSAVLVLPVNSALNPILYTVPLLMAKWEKFKTESAAHQGSKKTHSASLAIHASTKPREESTRHFQHNNGVMESNPDI